MAKKTTMISAVRPATGARWGSGEIGPARNFLHITDVTKPKPQAGTVPIPKWLQ